MGDHGLTYGKYLKIDELLELQKLKSEPEEHDEMLFIIIHQTYELWFKQILHEFGKLTIKFNEGDVFGSGKTLRRILTILKTLVSQVDILETMTPLEFNSFRGFLKNSSGFQSIQFRELEIICGMRTKLMLEAYKDEPERHDRLQSRMNEQTIWEAFSLFLNKHGFQIDVNRVNSQGLIFSPSEDNQQILLDIMKTKPELAFVCEMLVDFDEGLQEWRYRHVKMVERTIGMRKGTGGSEGVNYLLRTINQPIFPDLWAIRSLF